MLTILNDKEISLKKILILTILLSVLISACQAGGPSTQIHVELNDFTITPSQFTVPAGSEIQISIENKGAVIHDFYIMNLGLDGGEQFDDEDKSNAFWDAEVQSDSSVDLSFSAPDQPGTYQIVAACQDIYKRAWSERWMLSSRYPYTQAARKANMNGKETRAILALVSSALPRTLMAGAAMRAPLPPTQ